MTFFEKSQKNLAKICPPPGGGGVLLRLRPPLPSQNFPYLGGGYYDSFQILLDYKYITLFLYNNVFT